VTRAFVAACAALIVATGAHAGAQTAAGAAWLRERLAAARPGDVIDVPGGDYPGPFVIAVSVHLRGHGRAVLRGNGQTHVISVRASDVVIEGFEIRESGLDLSKDHAAVHVAGARAVVRDNRIVESLHGVYVRQADGARIERNVITGRSRTLERVDPFASPTPGGGEMCEVTLGQDRRGNGVHIWNSKDHVIAGNVIRDTRDGIYFSFVDRSEVRDNDIAGVRYGLHYMYSDDNRFEGNAFRDSAAGAALMYSKGITLRRNDFVGNRNHRAHGLLMYSVDETDVGDNRISGNTMGLFIEHSQGNRLTHNAVTNNHVGIHISNSSDGNTFADNTFVGNLHPVEASGTNMRNQWAVDGRGNYWDGAVRLDLDGNGIGDVPHRELDLYGELRRPFPAVALLAGSPGERLLRFVHARLALPGLPGVADPAPLLQVPRR
jgi:nitrous oxidase accessory protein